MTAPQVGLQSNISQSQLLIKAFKLIAKSYLFPKTPLRRWPIVLLYLHGKGFLYVGFEEDELAIVVCGYRVKKVPKEFPKKYPEKEEGTILYIPWMVSFAKDKFLPKKFLTRHWKKNPDIRVVAFHDHNDNDKIKIFTKQKQEENNG